MGKEWKEHDRFYLIIYVPVRRKPGKEIEDR